MAINFPDSPVDGQEVTLANTSWMYSTSKSAWLRTNRGITVDGLKVYNTISDLPISGLTAGQQAFISSSNTYYISNGSGWYSVTLVNTSPSITAVQDASANTTPFTLNTDGSTTVITVTATDPEDTPLIYSYSVTSGSLNGTTITQSSNVFTITPHASNATTFELTFTASDGINTATSGANSFSLSFSVWTTSYVETKVTDTQSTYTWYGAGNILCNNDATHILIPSMTNNVNKAAYWTRSGTSYTRVNDMGPGGSASGSNWGKIAACNLDMTQVLIGSNDRIEYWTRSGSTWTQRTVNTNLQGFFGKLSMSDGGTYIYGCRDSTGYLQQRVGKVGATALGDYVAGHGCGASMSGLSGMPNAISGNGNYVAYVLSERDWAIRYNGSSTPDGSWGVATNPTGTNWGAGTSQQLYSYTHTGVINLGVSNGAGRMGMAMNYEGDILAIVANQTTSCYIYTRSGTTWSHAETIDLSSAFPSGATRSVTMDSTGQILCISANGDESNNLDGFAIYETTNTDGTGYAQSVRVRKPASETSSTHFGYTLTSNMNVTISRDGRFAGAGLNPAVNYCYLYLME